MKSAALALSLLLIAAVVCSAAEATRPLTAADILQVREVIDPRISPDGKWVAFVVKQPPEKNGPGARANSDIWIAPADGSLPPRRFAFGPSEESTPRWSPDGKRFAFLSDRKEKGKKQILILDISGGEPRPITDSPEGVESFQWRPGSTEIAFTAQEPHSAEKQKRQAAGNDEEIADEFRPGVRLYELDIASGKQTPLSLPQENVNEFDYAPDGSAVVMSVSATSGMDDVFFRSHVVVLNTGNQTRREIGSRTYGMVRWSPDGTSIAHLAPIGRGMFSVPEIIQVSDGKARQPAAEYRGTIWEMDWLSSGQILVSSQEGAQGTLGLLHTDSFRMETLRKVGRVYDEPGNFSSSSGGRRIAFLDAASDSAQDVWTMNGDGSDLKRISDMNPQLSSFAFGRTETIEWKSTDGTAVEGILVKPVSWTAGKRYPLIVQIHGGPDWCWWNGWEASWQEWAQLLANNGYAVLLPNPRGSLCYGQKFAEASVNDWGGGDLADVLAGVDWLIQRGIADPDRLGIGGWSYGGFLTAWSITQTSRFKAAIVGAGLTDLMSAYGLHDIPTFTRAYLGSSPYENAAPYDQRSAVRLAVKIVTPTLILHGAEDTRVAPSQGRELYAALRDRGVKTQLVVYPREPHLFVEPAHQQDVLQRVLDWFDANLKR